MSHNHLTIELQMKSADDPKVLGDKLPRLMRQLFKAEDAIGTIHYSRFAQLNDKTLLFLADFDGEFGQLMQALARHAGPVFDAILDHVSNPPPRPVVDNGEAFAGWAAEHLINPFNIYTAYPDVTVRELKAMAAAAGVEGVTEQRPFLVVLPAKSYLAFIALGLLLKAKGRAIQKDLAKVGTPHFAQFVPLEDNQLGFFTVYDGQFDTYIADFTKNIGEVFDLIFKFTKNPPPSPCRKYLQEFIDFAAGANRAPIGFYKAYPGLSVQDIHALIADRNAIPASA